MAPVALFALIAYGCKRAPPATIAGVDAAGAEEAPFGVGAARHKPGETHGTLATASAHRCGECHGRLEQQWRESAHARAEHSAMYLAMAGAAGDDHCQDCHAPIDRLAGADSPSRGEGVTCDACHAMREAHADPAGGVFSLNLVDNTKYGPICDAKNHYFHKVACSPMHGESLQCGSCHLLYLPKDGGPSLPVYTEYEEWAASTSGATGVVCQDCHMPGTAAEDAVGAGMRPAVPNHGFMGSQDMRSRAIQWRIVVSGQKDTIRAAVRLRNSRAGHSLPTGMPGRRLVLRLRVFDAGARLVDVKERVFARILVDESGSEVPFYKAVRVASDNRIPADGVQDEVFDLTAPPGEQTGEVRLELLRADAAREVRATLGQPPPEEVDVLSVRVPFGRSAGPRARRQFLSRDPNVSTR
jgi:hypothetical protein